MVLPLSAPGFISTGIFAFIGAWNEFLIASVMTNNATKTFPGAAGPIHRGETTAYEDMFAAAVLGTIPGAHPGLYLSTLYYSRNHRGGVKIVAGPGQARRVWPVIRIQETRSGEHRPANHELFRVDGRLSRARRPCDCRPQGGILGLAPTAELLEQYSARKILDGKDKLALRAWWNAYTHTVQQLRGAVVVDEPPMVWLRILIPFERALTRRTFTQRALVLRADDQGRHHVLCGFRQLFMEPVIQAVQETGMRRASRA